MLNFPQLPPAADREIPLRDIELRRQCGHDRTLTSISNAATLNRPAGPSILAIFASLPLTCGVMVFVTIVEVLLPPRIIRDCVANRPRLTVANVAYQAGQLDHRRHNYLLAD